MSKPSVSIIVACLNEEKNIEETVKRIHKSLPEAEILIIDGGNDKTSEIANSLNISQVKTVKQNPNKGKGEATIIGINSASGEIQAQIDADCQFLPEELPKLLEPVIEGKADISLGSRFIRGSNVPKGTLTPIRRLANFVISSYTSLLIGRRVTDIGAGFKAWKTDVMKDVNLRCMHYAYEAEIIVKGYAKGYKLVEVPCSYANRQYGISNVNLWRDGVLMPWYLLKLRLRILLSKSRKKK
jgi:dolichol-phosphate mannosyltransferase